MGGPFSMVPATWLRILFEIQPDERGPVTIQMDICPKCVETYMSALNESAARVAKQTVESIAKAPHYGPVAHLR